MCKFLKISRSLIYYQSIKRNKNVPVSDEVVKIFHDCRNNYGSRKIKVKLAKVGHQVSRRKIRRIMIEDGLVSNYTVKQYKVHKSTCNNAKVKNVVNREFDREEPLRCSGQ